MKVYRVHFSGDDYIVSALDRDAAVDLFANHMWKPGTYFGDPERVAKAKAQLKIEELDINPSRIVLHIRNPMNDLRA